MRTFFCCVTFFLTMLAQFVFCIEPTYAVTIVPVADLIGQPADNKLYYSLPLCTKPVTSCQRIHQILFNEIVTIEEEKGDQVRISLNSVFYEQTPCGPPQTTFWSLKKNFMTLDQLQSKKISLSTIPQPINFRTQKNDTIQQETIALLFPHYDSSTRTTYSAGTRFVIAQRHHEIHNTYAVSVIDPHSVVEKIIHLPTTKCIHIDHGQPLQKKRNQFVAILRNWAKPGNGFIPYVWGGCSFTQLHHEKHFIEHKETGGIVNYNPLHGHHTPHAGFDCAGMIVRAAQLCTLPFYYKNTATMANHLKEIKNDASIEEGDIIWFPGHVMVISNLKTHTIIEARAYAQGYGKVHELPLNVVFKEIETFDQLLATAQTKKTILRLQKNGTVSHAISNLKLFKLIDATNQPFSY